MSVAFASAIGSYVGVRRIIPIESSFTKEYERRAEELDLQQNNVAVKDAWDQYQIILQLSRK